MGDEIMDLTDSVVVAPSNYNAPNIFISPAIFTGQHNNGTGTSSSSYVKDDDQLIIRQEGYWQQLLTDFKQLKLYDFVWLEPIKDAASQAEDILQKILHPGKHKPEMSTQKGTYQPPDMLDEIVSKLGNIRHSSKKLIQLYRPSVEEIEEEESGTFVRLVNRSDKLENAFTELKEKVNNINKLSAEDVRLDMLLKNFKDVTKDRRLLHNQSIKEVMRNMAESIHNCKNGISFLCMEAIQSTMVGVDTCTSQQGCRHHRYYIHIPDRLYHFAGQLAIVLAKIKCSRDRLFDDDFSCGLVEMMNLEKEPAPIFHTLKNQSAEQYCNSRLKAFLKDAKVMQQSYKDWKELTKQKNMMYTFPEEQSIYCTSWFEFDPDYALDVVLQWDPFNSISCIAHAEVLVRIFSPGVSEDSLSTVDSLQNYAKSISRVASSRLNDLFHCLINSIAAFQNVEAIQIYSYAIHSSRYFCASSGASSSKKSGTPSSSAEQRSSCLSLFSSSQNTSLSSHPIDIPSSKIRQKWPTYEMEPAYEKERAPDGRIIYLFSEAISNLKQLADMLARKKCIHVLSKAFRETFEAAMEQKLAYLGFHYGAREELEKLGTIEESALRERRRTWGWAFKVLVYELLPWPKFLCDEIFSDNIDDIKEFCFYEYAKLCLKPLLEFADAACSAMLNRAGRIFHQLHVHEVLSEIYANISVVLQESEPTQLSLSGEVAAVIKKLEMAILDALADFRNQIQNDRSCIKWNEVDVHHLTRSTMSFVKRLSHHRITINSILYEEYSFSNRKSLFPTDCHQFMLLLLSCLATKLVEKSQLLESIVAAQVFWINNLGYMTEEVANPELRIILGEQWVQEQNDKTQEYLVSYEAAVLAEVQPCLYTLRGSAYKTLNNFKLSIEEMCKVGASWKVPNPKWRSALRNAAVNVVVSVYNGYWYKLHPGMRQNIILEISIEEELEYLKSRILDLFEG